MLCQTGTVFFSILWLYILKLLLYNNHEVLYLRGELQLKISEYGINGIDIVAKM